MRNVGARFPTRSHVSGPTHIMIPRKTSRVQNQGSTSCRQVPPEVTFGLQVYVNLLRLSIPNLDNSKFVRTRCVRKLARSWSRSPGHWSGRRSMVGRLRTALRPVTHSAHHLVTRGGRSGLETRNWKLGIRASKKRRPFRLRHSGSGATQSDRKAFRQDRLRKLCTKGVSHSRRAADSPNGHRPVQALRHQTLDRWMKRYPRLLATLD